MSTTCVKVLLDINPKQIYHSAALAGLPCLLSKVHPFRYNKKKQAAVAACFYRN
ncbi:hypothetical protein ACFCW7_17335 [Paenibacillus glucanolyticus]|jgi:hypothetical protein|uniref:hypothetical protein n=1 Tax=Paenibacillus glucanolyticus TaxID=59843 RepID=UPI0035DF29E9